MLNKDQLQHVKDVSEVNEIPQHWSNASMTAGYTGTITQSLRHGAYDAFKIGSKEGENLVPYTGKYTKG